ncbi:hypothetical protein S7335_1029 [Synechococcus sp. PCC 7335]|uniref:hypothetical protein n=1 Tax=Synechococcus sp. (strain ATCC 29403 / PCC 7335) TaxID=91464 RepID=UPI00017ECF33|nr:hypothetical protein [Synechococcus sp. PCC 7335]EDX82726.1 hypothetical protein S7335_1029 [Synechococcus sp. PCC 7335]
MPSLVQQLSHLVEQLEALRDAIPVDEQALGLTIEQHSPGNGSTYTRLRAPKGMTLPNGNRTMRLGEEEVVEWQQKISARNQKARVAQCLLLVQQAADVASSIIWEVEANRQLVKKEKRFTKRKSKKADATTKPKRAKNKSAASKKPKLTIKYVLKDASNATVINRKVHAIAQAEPKSGRWYAPALCGEQPKAGSWGWRTCDPSDFSCPKCFDKLQLLL